MNFMKPSLDNRCFFKRRFDMEIRATLVQEPKMDSFQNTGVEITRVIANLVSIRNSSDVFGFFSNCSSFCLEREFQMRNLTFHFSPRANRLLRVSMNVSYELYETFFR